MCNSVLTAGLFDVVDEGLLKCFGARFFNQGGWAIAGQNLARVHERDPVAALGLVHEVRRDENRDLVFTREINHQLPESVAGDGVDA